jgi:hypothetical protein
MSEAYITAIRCAIRDKVLTRMPCEICGITGRKSMSNGVLSSIVHAHHDDYNKPLEVRWLCKAHHKKWHSYRRPIRSPELEGLIGTRVYQWALEQIALEIGLKEGKDKPTLRCWARGSIQVPGLFVS